jgi:exopolysaccharide production protein ExoY
MVARAGTIKAKKMLVPASRRHASTPPKVQLSKRLFDLILAAGLLIFLAPLLLLLMFALTLDGGPVFVSGWFVGLNGREFRCRGFRIHLTRNRLTRLGEILSRSGLDQLPALFSILVGDMSFVGPRPIEAAEIGRYVETALEAYYVCRPGFTGLSHFGGSNIASYQEVEQLNRRYVSEWSLWLDLIILGKTFLAYDSLS